MSIQNNFTPGDLVFSGPELEYDTRPEMASFGMIISLSTNTMNVMLIGAWWRRAPRGKVIEYPIKQKSWKLIR